MVDFVTRVVGWNVQGRYFALSYEVNSAWDQDSAALRQGAVPDLRGAVAADPRFAYSSCTAGMTCRVHSWARC